MYKCAIIGVSGGRARGHAEAFRLVKRGKLAAVSSRNREKLDAFADTFGVGPRYTDYREMLERERPDLVFVNTPPDVRLEVLEAAREAGTPGVVLEKPLAIQGEDYRAIMAFADEVRRSGGGPKVAINHQLHFHPRRLALQRLVADGKIGEVLFAEASSGMNLAYQGTHSLQALGAFLPGRAPLTVFGQLAGAAGLAETPARHYAPDESMASIAYEGGVDAVLRCGANAPRVGERPVHGHKRIAVYGTAGAVHWTMWSWATLIGGSRDAGEHRYQDEDIQGQAGLTEAMFDWLEDDEAVHPLNLEAALVDFSVILGLYQSALNRTVVPLPVEPEERLIERLRAELCGAAGPVDGSGRTGVQGAGR